MINPHAAGIDVGSEKLHVAIVNGPVQVFDTFTESLYALRDMVLAAGVTTVAMEATGVYWLAVYEVLEAAGLEVCVVNGAHVKSLPGRKSDLQDCQWLAELHSCGLLRSGFLPSAIIRRLRDYQRLRQDHIRMASAHIQHMQKALDRMNLKIHEVLSDLTGVSGLRLVRALVQGVRNRTVLLELCDQQILRHKRERMLKALRGHWKDEHLFALRQALEGWEFYQRQIADCDQQITRVLQDLAGPSAPPPPDAPTSAAPKRLQHNAPHIDDLHPLLLRITGSQDLSALPALSDYSVLQLLGEVGTDMTRWPTVKHFTAWLGLAPSSRRSGKRRRREKRFRGRAGQLFCVVARTLARSKYLALGGFYRRLRATRGPEVANIAAARKIAVLFYNTLRYGLQYVEQGLQRYEETYRQQCLRRLERNARQLGFTLVQGSLSNA
ncbi:MAG TPA: IS110 family transposase [Candidatus Margulisiibacteriota bacterium]|nr:IS110 family transposase [Candidatus Margulisiibacteriota bacterium]